MANEKEEVLKANAGAPSADIPDLKKKDKERKKAGAAWSGVRGAAGEFSGATGGNVARAAASAASMAEGALAEGALAEGGGFLASLSRFFTGLMGTMLGKMAVAAAAFLLMAAAGLVGYEMMKGNNASVGTPDLGGIADTMKVRSGGGDRMGVNSRGELRFDPAAKAPAAAPAAPVTDAKAADATPAPAKADADAQKPVPSGLLAHNLKGAQLSSSLGGGFGDKNIFAGNNSAPKFGSGAGGNFQHSASKGQLSSMKASTLHASAATRSVGKASGSKAFGQLKFANKMSASGAGATTSEAAANAGQSAFDQQQTNGGGLSTPSGGPGDTVAPPGSGAPSTSGSGDGNIPNPTPSATDPGLQNALSQIQSLINQAMSDITTGIIEMVAGAALIVAGCCCLPWGGLLIAAGIALMAIGYMTFSKGQQEEATAKQMGQSLADSINNQQQANVINYCTNSAIASGTQVQNCQPPDSVTNATAIQQNDDTSTQRVTDYSNTPSATISQ